MNIVWNQPNRAPFTPIKQIIKRLAEYSIVAEVVDSEFANHKAVAVAPEKVTKASQVCLFFFGRNAWLGEKVCDFA